MQFRRSPLGLRGLKYHLNKDKHCDTMSQPSWAAWIEMEWDVPKLDLELSQPSWAAWIEIRR